MTVVPIKVLSADGTALFTVTPREEFDEWRGGYLACALRFAGMHDAIAEAFDAPIREPALPQIAELRGPSENGWDCFAEDEDEAGWPQVAPVGRARRVVERLVHGR